MQMINQSVTQMLRAAWPAHKDGAQLAFALFDSWCSDGMRNRVPGMGTTERLAIRLYQGRTVEQAAAREYLYRWHLAILAPDQCIGHSVRNPCVSIFGTPHTIGM